MRVAVISDTHLHEPNQWMRAVFNTYLEPADAVVHCGDMAGQRFHAWLAASHPNVHAVPGNMDGWDWGGMLRPEAVFSLGGLRCGLAHGWGPRSEVSHAVYRHFGPELDIIFFGHTHRFLVEKIGRTWLINPGACQPCGSLALVTLAQGEDPAVERIELPE